MSRELNEGNLQRLPSSNHNTALQAYTFMQRWYTETRLFRGCAYNPRYALNVVKVMYFENVLGFERVNPTDWKYDLYLQKEFKPFKKWITKNIKSVKLRIDEYHEDRAAKRAGGQ